MKFEEFKIKYKDKEGNVITHQKLEELLRDNSYRLIKKEEIGETFLSTVWLGIPHFGGHYFETSTFKNGKFDDILQRYSTLKDAEMGHERHLKNLKK